MRKPSQYDVITSGKRLISAHHIHHVWLRDDLNPKRIIIDFGSWDDRVIISDEDEIKEFLKGYLGWCHKNKIFICWPANCWIS